MYSAPLDPGNRAKSRDKDPYFCKLSGAGNRFLLVIQPRLDRGRENAKL